jgi:hypothetical protein
MFVISVLLSAGPRIASAEQMFERKSEYTDDDAGKVAVRPGMEIKEVEKDVNALVPEDGNVYRDADDRCLIEGTDEYAARRFKNMQAQIEAL